MDEWKLARRQGFYLVSTWIIFPTFYLLVREVNSKFPLSPLPSGNRQFCWWGASVCPGVYAGVCLLLPVPCGNYIRDVRDGLGTSPQQTLATPCLDLAWETALPGLIHLPKFMYSLYNILYTQFRLNDKIRMTHLKKIKNWSDSCPFYWTIYRDYFNACLPAGRRGKYSYPCISGTGTDIQRVWITCSPAPTHRGPGEGFSGCTLKDLRTHAGCLGVELGLWNVHPEKAKSWAAGAAPCKRGRQLSGNEVVLSWSLGQPHNSPQALNRGMILQGWPPTWELRSSRTWLLWAQVLFNLRCPRAHPPQGGSFVPHPRAQPSYHCPGLSELSLLVFALTWRSNDMNVYLGGFLSSRGLVSSDVTGSVFFFPWEAGSGTVDKGSEAAAATAVSQSSLEAMTEWEDP